MRCWLGGATRQNMRQMPPAVVMGKAVGIVAVIYRVLFGCPVLDNKEKKS